jgi:hypothetical protein
MKGLNLANGTLAALVASCFMQIGAQLFALVVVAGTVASAPPRSFAILTGEYRYDSGAFWNVAPLVTLVLFVVALTANWKTGRRVLLLAALALFVAGGMAAGLLLEPVFADMIARGYRDEVDPVLQRRAGRWYTMDWMVWGLSLLAGVSLLLALVRPPTVRIADEGRLRPAA